MKGKRISFGRILILHHDIDYNSQPRRQWLKPCVVHSCTSCLHKEHTQILHICLAAYNKSTQLVVRDLRFMKTRMKRHSFILDSREIIHHDCISQIMDKFFKIQYFLMALLHDECRSNAWLAARLYQQRFTAGPHSSYKTVLKIMKILNTTGYVTSYLYRQTKIGWQILPEDVLSYSLHIGTA